ncbi:thioredoxin family protein, partial [Persicitalea sp.]|uniref:thioredoxin family protein n=1 Tax=Persicitalea sp. TaxID=3100273 RepID=UPI003594191C
NHANSDYGIGDVVVNFRLKNVEGNTVSLSDFSNQKGVIVIFTCNHCPFSKAYEGRISALHSKFSGLGYPVLAINPSDPKSYDEDRPERLKEMANVRGNTYSYLIDDSQVVARAFGASRTPQAYVLKNNGGKFIVQYMGNIDDNPQDPANVTKRNVEDAVVGLLAGRAVATATTKPIGCVIK